MTTTKRGAWDALIAYKNWIGALLVLVMVGIGLIKYEYVETLATSAVEIIKAVLGQ